MFEVSSTGQVFDRVSELGVDREAAQFSKVQHGMKAGGKKRPQLGLVCITASEAVRYRTMTRKRLQLDAVEQKNALRLLYGDNLARR